MHNGRLEVRLDTSLESLMENVARDGRPGVLATVVATAGSTYRKPGARMLIRSDGSYFGLLSGGCLEADLAIHARQVQETGLPRAVEYDMRGPDDVLFGIGAGCEGAMRVLLEPAGPGSPAAASLAIAADATRAGRSTSLIIVHESMDMVLGTHDPAAASWMATQVPTRSPVPAPAPVLLRAAQRALADAESRGVDYELAGRRTRAFVEFLAPPPHILICGAGPDAQPVAAAAMALGWRVTVVDHRPAYALAHRFPGAAVHCGDAGNLRSTVSVAECHAVVVMSHHLPSDVAYLRELAEAGVPEYVGLLGPSARRRRIAEELGGASEKLHSRLRGPVGFDIGAVTPEGIALAIISEIHAWLAARPDARFLPLA
jgi:xanthine/CO dehydrogenase XdhC/CoxF family maturation factor